MLYVYRVNVTLSGKDNRLFINKDIIRCRILKHGTKKYKLSASPKEWADDRFSYVEVPISDCFSELKDAKIEADKRADEIFAKAIEILNKLKIEAEVIDKLGVAS